MNAYQRTMGFRVTAFWQGYHAAEEGKKPEDNPYAQGMLADDWRDGWNDFFADQQRKAEAVAKHATWVAELAKEA